MIKDMYVARSTCYFLLLLRPKSTNDNDPCSLSFKEKASSSTPRVTKAAWVSNAVSLILAALNAMFPLAVFANITIEMLFDHHRI